MDAVFQDVFLQLFLLLFFYSSNYLYCADINLYETARYGSRRYLRDDYDRVHSILMKVIDLIECD